MAGVVGAKLGPAVGAVGGRLEAVAPKRSLYAPDYIRLAALAAVAVAVHAWLVTHTATTARDGIGFARYAINLQTPQHVLPVAGDKTPRAPTPLGVMKDAQHPPGYPVLVWAMGKVVRNGFTLPHPDTYLLAAQLVSSIAGVLLVIPTYLTGRMLFGRSAGFAAALLLQVLPTPARLTSDALSEGTYLLVASTAVLLGVRAVRRPGVGGFILCGMASGLTYLIRPEGLLVAGAVGVTAAVLGLAKRWPRDAALGRLAALAVGVAFVAGPYMLLIRGVTNKPTGQDMLNPGQNPRVKVYGGGAALRATGPLFAEWRTADGAPSALWAANAIGKEAVKALFYVPAGLAVLAVVVLRRRVAADPGLWVLLILVGLNAVLLMALALTKGYVSERHTMLFTLVGCVFAAAALEPVSARLGRWARPEYLLVAISVAALVGTLKPLHANREGHRHAGRWLAAHLTDADVLIDPFEWAQWYSGRSLYFVPPDPPDARVLYTVIETNPATPHSRLDRLDLARDVARSGTVVYHWPEDGPADRATVQVVRTTR